MTPAAADPPTRMPVSVVGGGSPPRPLPLAAECGGRRDRRRRGGSEMFIFKGVWKLRLDSDSVEPGPTLRLTRISHVVTVHHLQVAQVILGNIETNIPQYAIEY